MEGRRHDYAVLPSEAVPVSLQPTSREDAKTAQVSLVFAGPQPSLRASLPDRQQEQSHLLPGKKELQQPHQYQPHQLLPHQPVVNDESVRSQSLMRAAPAEVGPQPPGICSPGRQPLEVQQQNLHPPVCAPFAMQDNMLLNERYLGCQPAEAYVRQQPQRLQFANSLSHQGTSSATVRQDHPQLQHEVLEHLQPLPRLMPQHQGPLDQQRPQRIQPDTVFRLGMQHGTHQAAMGHKSLQRVVGQHPHTPSVADAADPVQAQEQQQPQQTMLVGRDGSAHLQASLSASVPLRMKSCDTTEALNPWDAPIAASHEDSVTVTSLMSGSSTVQGQQRSHSVGFPRADKAVATQDESQPRKGDGVAATTKHNWVCTPGVLGHQQVKQLHPSPPQSSQGGRRGNDQSGQTDGVTFCQSISSPIVEPARLAPLSRKNSSNSSSSGRRRPRGEVRQGSTASVQASRSSQRETAPSQFFSKSTGYPDLAVVGEDITGSAVRGSNRKIHCRSADSGTGVRDLSGDFDHLDIVNLPAATQEHRMDTAAIHHDSVTSCPAACAGVLSPVSRDETKSHGASSGVRVRTVSPEHEEDTRSRRELWQRESKQPRSASVTASISLSEAAASVAKRASSAFSLPPLGTNLPPELLSDLKQHASASSAAHHAVDEVAEQLEVLRKAKTSCSSVPSLRLTEPDGRKQREKGPNLSHSARTATETGGAPCSGGSSRTRRMQEGTDDAAGPTRERRSFADTASGLRHRPLLRHETNHFRGGTSKTRQRVFLSDSMGRTPEKDRRWTGSRVARPLWHDIPSEETPRKLNLTSFVGETWTSRLKGKLIIVVRRLPFDIRTTSNCLAKLECLLLGQSDSLQSPTSPSPLSSRRVGGSYNTCDKGEWKGTTGGTGTPKQPTGYRGPPLRVKSLAPKTFINNEESLIGSSRSTDDMNRLSTGGPPRSWGSAAEADVETDSGRRDAFRLRSLALARELLRRVRSEMQLVPQRGKAIRNLLEAPFGTSSANRPDSNVVQSPEAIPTNPADCTPPAAARRQRRDASSEPDLLHQHSDRSVGRGVYLDSLDCGITPSSAVSAPLGNPEKASVAGGERSFPAQSREKSIGECPTPQSGGEASATDGAATDGLVVLRGADIAWDIATTLKPYVPCITISDLGIDWEEMGLTGSEQQLMQQRVLDTVRKQHPSVHPISLGKEARRECYSEQILNTLFHCRTPPVGELEESGR